MQTNSIGGLEFTRDIKLKRYCLTKVDKEMQTNFIDGIEFTRDIILKRHYYTTL